MTPLPPHAPAPSLAEGVSAASLSQAAGRARNTARGNDITASAQPAPVFFPVPGTPSPAVLPRAAGHFRN